MNKLLKIEINVIFFFLHYFWNLKEMLKIYI